MRTWLQGATLALGLIQGALAAPILNQPIALVDGRSSHLSGSPNNFITYDRIALISSYSVNKVSWVGAFIDLQTPANNPVLPEAVSWGFRVASDVANAPGLITDSASLAFGDATQEFLGTGNLAGQAAYFYRFTALLDDPLMLEGGVNQWFSVFAEGPDTVPLFAWISGSGGDGVSSQFLANGTFVGNYTDRALTLEGNLVPEPPMLMLLLPALGAALALRRRSR